MEDLEWVVHVPLCFSITIYNKGNRIASKPVRDRASHVYDVPNIGRESETYLRHILESTRTARGYTVFTQGNPFEHSPDFVPLLGVWQSWEEVQPLSWCYLRERHIPPSNILENERHGFVDGLRVRKEYYSLYTLEPTQFVDEGAIGISLRYSDVHKLHKGVNVLAHFLNSCGFSTIAGQASKHFGGCFAYGAIFAVGNEIIDGVSKEACSRAWRLSKSHEIHGWVLERTWLHLWGEPSVFPRPVKASLA
jgi:hypothetical protein